jgi:hypothetical protein
MSNAVLGGAVGPAVDMAHSTAYPALEVLHITGIAAVGAYGWNQGVGPGTS